MGGVQNIINLMNLPIYNQVEKFVIDSFNKINKSEEIKHFLRTVYWLKELKPDTDEALLTAAVSHDIERAFRQKDMDDKKTAVGFAGVEYYKTHELRGAEIVVDFLKKQNVQNDFIERVSMLISQHEEGGNDDQNLLKDADCISFFENNVSFFVSGSELTASSVKKVKHKLDWMFDKITSEQAEQIAKPFYEDAIKVLNNN
ncbi:MAG: hypothetical protein US58_C0022G0011 [Candidatus Magasanikbacteria bacterium GW2011_GWA2_37_8]|uniref:HD domain-containing protein n=1 Tax=Candidatus Magasanikbacteria bacterium GW2011_GWA2_37_8 TaxID=1619036 RepID=A0A0G0HDJ2_9BACT|nr:MAG: hypothetical protein US58_C0022G0011 [Candidatus Magasanikbacteria bacterium GW2011_GWA2_37_8]